MQRRRRQFRHPRHDLCGVRAWSPGRRRQVGRPVKWTSERHEAFLSDYQARDLAVEAELALDAEGKFLAMRGSNLGNLGAHTTNYSRWCRRAWRSCRASTACRRRISAPALRSVNTSPTRPYRSAGRPEVMYVMERLIDLAARECGYRPRRDPPAQSRDRATSCRTGIRSASIYDSGDYHGAMDMALQARRLGRLPSAPRRGQRSAASCAASASPTTSTPRPACRASAPR